MAASHLNEQQYLSILADEIINDPNFEQFLSEPSSNLSSRKSSYSSNRTDSTHSLISLIDDELTHSNSVGSTYRSHSSNSTSSTNSSTFSSSTSLVFASKAIHLSSKSSTNLNIDLSSCITPKRKSQKLPVPKRKRRKSKRKRMKLNKRSKSSLFIKPINVNKITPTKSKSDIDLYITKPWKLIDLIREIVSSDYDKAERARNVLILCHLSFMTSCDLFTELRRIFNMSKSEMAYTMFKFDEFQSPSDQIYFIRLKLTECILYWIKHYWIEDFINNKQLQNQIELFKSDINQIQSIQKTKLFHLLSDTMQCIKTKYGNCNNIIFNSTPSIANRFPNLSKLEIKLENVQLMEINPIDIAQQITLLDSEIFKAINDRECIEQKWKGKDKLIDAPHVLNSIAQFNDINKWVQLTILNGETARKRKTLLKRMITMCTYFMEYGNLSALCAFHSALISKNILGLKQTWKLLSNKSSKEWENIKQLFGWKMNKFKYIQLNLQAPSVPHMGVILEKLFQIDEMHKQHKNNSFINTFNEYINCGKMMMLYEQIDNIKRLQSKCYQYDTDVEIQKLLINQFEMNEKYDEMALHKLAKSVANVEKNLS